MLRTILLQLLAVSCIASVLYYLRPTAEALAFVGETKPAPINKPSVPVVVDLDPLLNKVQLNLNHIKHEMPIALSHLQAPNKHHQANGWADFIFKRIAIEVDQSLITANRLDQIICQEGDLNQRLSPASSQVIVLNEQIKMLQKSCAMIRNQLNANLMTQENEKQVESDIVWFGRLANRVEKQLHDLDKFLSKNQRYARTQVERRSEIQSQLNQYLSQEKEAADFLDRNVAVLKSWANE